MDLKNFTKHLIYQSANTQIPDNFSRFQILHPEYSAHESVVKTYPLPENEHLFSLLWDIHDGHMLSATILPPSPRSFMKKSLHPACARRCTHTNIWNCFISLTENTGRKFWAMNLLFTGVKSA